MPLKALALLPHSPEWGFVAYPLFQARQCHSRRWRCCLTLRSGALLFNLFPKRANVIQGAGAAALLSGVWRHIYV